MAEPRTPDGIRVFVQSDALAKQIITAISKTNPAVVTYAGADPANNDYLALTDMYGMTEFEDALVKAANVVGAANTFECQDQDSLAYGSFISGNMNVLTLGTEINIATGFSFNGFEQQFKEYRLLKDRLTRKKPTTISAGGFDLPCIWDPFDPGLIAMRKAAEASKKLGFKLLFPDGLEMLFFGHVGASGLPGSGDIIETKLSVSIATMPRYVIP